jgi:hypothetical protein
MQEATIKKELIKPEFKGEVKAEIKTLGEIEDNIQEVKEYALELKEYYSDIVFTEDAKKDAENQKAEINKQKSKIAEYRKAIIEKYNEPIEKFKTTAMETEKILKEAYDFINNQVKAFDEKELQSIREKIEWYFDEYKKSQEVDFVKFEQLNLNITKGLITSTGNLTKKVQDTITSFIDNVKKDLELIKTLEFKDEILLEYKTTLKCASAIANVQDRHRQLEEMQKPLTDEVVQEKIEEKLNYVSAPQVEEQKYQMTFTVFGTKSQLKELKNYLEKEGLLNE